MFYTVTYERKTPENTCSDLQRTGSKTAIATFHRPHPEKEAKPYQVKDARNFLTGIGVKP